jgi:hypothetical protein
VTEPNVRDGLLRLRSRWPRGLRVDEAFAEPANVLDDLRLLQQNGLVTLRLEAPAEPDPADAALHRLEAEHGGYRTSAAHVRQPVVPGSTA